MGGRVPVFLLVLRAESAGATILNIYPLVRRLPKSLQRLNFSRCYPTPLWKTVRCWISDVAMVFSESSSERRGKRPSGDTSASTLIERTSNRARGDTPSLDLR